MLDKDGLLSKQELHDVYDRVMTEFVPTWFLEQFKAELIEIWAVIDMLYENDVTQIENNPKATLRVIKGGLS